MGQRSGRERSRSLVWPSRLLRLVFRSVFLSHALQHRGLFRRRGVDGALLRRPGGVDRRANQSAAQGTVVYLDDRRPSDSRLSRRDGLGLPASSAHRVGERGAVERSFGGVGADQHRQPRGNGFRAGTRARATGVHHGGRDLSLDQPGAGRGRYGPRHRSHTRARPRHLTSGFSRHPCRRNLHSHHRPGGFRCPGRPHSASSLWRSPGC